MNNDHYLLTGGDNAPIYYFVSEGCKGTVIKGIFFQLIDEDDELYNLAFGDWYEELDYLDDNVRTDNKDTQKVLNTVAVAVHDFMERNPRARVLATGSTKSRTRLYQINILKNLQAISYDYSVQGFRDGHWEPFVRGINYDAFLLTWRSLTLC